MDEQKAVMLKSMEETGGNVSDACKLAGIDRRQYYRWRRQDADFAARADDIREEMTDRVEARLMKLIADGDAQSTMFYLRTRGKMRGYSTTMIRAGAMDGSCGTVSGAGSASGTGLPPDEEDLKKAAEANRRSIAAKKRAVKNKKDYIVRMLKKEGKYTPEMAVQCKLAARLLVRCDELEEEIYSSSHQAVKTEYSREGNERQVVASSEKLYMLYLAQAQRALRALGMNTEGKERKADGKGGLDSFLSAFNEDD